MQDHTITGSLKNDLIRVHYYPDILDLRYSGYELERFENLLLALDSASYRNALRVSSMLHRLDASPIWNYERADQVELLVLDTLYEYGVHKVPQLLKNVVGRVFEEGASSHLTADLVKVFYWACLAEVARDYAWREEKLAEWAEYLTFPMRAIFKL